MFTIHDAADGRLIAEAPDYEGAILARRVLMAEEEALRAYIVHPAPPTREAMWYEWGRRDWRDLGRHCFSIRGGQVAAACAAAYKAGYRDARAAARAAILDRQEAER
jgi:hypothetical protein